MRGCYDKTTIDQPFVQRLRTLPVQVCDLRAVQVHFITGVKRDCRGFLSWRGSGRPAFRCVGKCSFLDCAAEAGLGKDGIPYPPATSRVCLVHLSAGAFWESAPRLLCQDRYLGKTTSKDHTFRSKSFSRAGSRPMLALKRYIGVNLVADERDIMISAESGNCVQSIC